MPRIRILTATLVVLTLLLSALAAPAVAASGKRSYIVVLRSGGVGPAAAAKQARKGGASVEHVYKHTIKGYAAKLSDAEVAAIRAWILRVRQSLAIRPAPTKNAARARAWRDRRRGRPARPVTDWTRDRVCARAGHPLTTQNVRTDPNGQRSCRVCLNERMRAYRRTLRRTCSPLASPLRPSTVAHSGPL